MSNTIYYTHRCTRCTRMVCLSPGMVCEDCIANEQCTESAAPPTALPTSAHEYKMRWLAAHSAPCAVSAEPASTYNHRCLSKFDNYAAFKGVPYIPVPESE